MTSGIDVKFASYLEMATDLRDARARIADLEAGRANDDRDYRRDVAHIAALERDLAASRKEAAEAWGLLRSASWRSGALQPKLWNDIDAHLAKYADGATITGSDGDE